MDIVCVCRKCGDIKMYKNVRCYSNKQAICRKCGNSQVKHLKIINETKHNLQDFGIDSFNINEYNLQQVLKDYPGFTIIKVKECE